MSSIFHMPSSFEVPTLFPASESPPILVMPPSGMDWRTLCRLPPRDGFWCCLCLSGAGSIWHRRRRGERIFIVKDVMQFPIRLLWSKVDAVFSSVFRPGTNIGAPFVRRHAFSLTIYRIPGDSDPLEHPRHSPFMRLHNLVYPETKRLFPIGYDAYNAISPSIPDQLLLAKGIPTPDRASARGVCRLRPETLCRRKNGPQPTRLPPFLIDTPPAYTYCILHHSFGAT